MFILSLRSRSAQSSGIFNYFSLQPFHKNYFVGVRVQTFLQKLKQATNFVFDGNHARSPTWMSWLIRYGKFRVNLFNVLMDFSGAYEARRRFEMILNFFNSEI